jgi:hypothetical protein
MTEARQIGYNELKTEISKKRNNIFGKDRSKSQILALRASRKIDKLREKLGNCKNGYSSVEMVRRWRGEI